MGFGRKVFVSVCLAGALTFPASSSVFAASASADADVSASADAQPQAEQRSQRTGMLQLPSRSQGGSSTVVHNKRDVLNAGNERKSLSERVQAILHPPAPPVPVYSSMDADFILGHPLATQEQCVRYLLSMNPAPAISVPPERLVSYYYEEGEREGVRPDVAFAQALKETSCAECSCFCSYSFGHRAE